MGISEGGYTLEDPGHVASGLTQRNRHKHSGELYSRIAVLRNR